MVSKEGIREYFSRHLFGHLKVLSFPIAARDLEVLSPKRAVAALGNPIRARVVSSVRTAIGKIECKSSALNLREFKTSVKGGKVARYAPGEIKAKKLKIKFAVGIKRWKKEFAALPQQRKNRLKFVPENMRRYQKGELELAYFWPIIENNVARLILNKQDGTLFVWYNPDARAFAPKGLFMFKRFGEKDVGWRWE